MGTPPGKSFDFESTLMSTTCCQVRVRHSSVAMGGKTPHHCACDAGRLVAAEAGNARESRRKHEQDAQGYKSARCSLLGNSFQVHVLAWLLGQLLARLGETLEAPSVQSVIEGVRVELAH